MFVPRHVGHCSVRTDGVEHPAHECTAHEHGEHRFPACDACPQQQDGAEGDGNDAGFTDGARNKAGHHVPRELRISARSSGCSQRSGNGEPVYRLSQTEDAVARYPNGIPVPPNTSLAKITENAVATARIHNGQSTGTIIGIKIPETRKPS